MKTHYVFLAVLLAVFSFNSSAFAGGGDTEPVEASTNEGADAGKAISIDDGTNTLILNFSPSINALYETDASETANNKQWYAVATYHSGGTKFFGSSSDSTVVYKQDRGTTEVFSDAGVPDAKADPDADPPETADSIWAGWSK